MTRARIMAPVALLVLSGATVMLLAVPKLARRNYDRFEDPARGFLENSLPHIMESTS